MSQESLLDTLLNTLLRIKKLSPVLRVNFAGLFSMAPFHLAWISAGKLP